MKLLLAIVTAVLTLSGCATTSPQSAEEVAANQVMNRAMWSRPASSFEGTLVIIRASQFTGIVCTYSILVDGNEVALLDNGQKVTLNLIEGQHVISVQMGKDGCGHSYAEQRIQVVPGRQEKLLIEVGTFDGLTIKPYN